MSSFNYIRNQIRLYKKEDLIDRCFFHLNANRTKVSAIWDIFIILKWTYEYGGEKYPTKILTDSCFNKIYTEVAKLNDDYLITFIKQGQAHKWFQVLHSQQFYLQKPVMLNHLATQLKLYDTIQTKYNIKAVFAEKTGMTINTFILTLQTVWLIINAPKEGTSIVYYGNLNPEHIEALELIVGKENAELFVDLLSIDPLNAKQKIQNASHNVKTTEWHSLAKTFFTLYPFQKYKNYIKVIHDSVFNYTTTYIIYDLLKNINGFTIDFGKRIEIYVGLGLKEIGITALGEKMIKQLLPNESNVPDYFIQQQNIIIECKAIELNAFSSVNPTDEVMYNSLRGSIIKAYSKQMLTLANNLDIKEECFGLIITYKEFFTSKFTDIYHLCEKEIPLNLSTQFLPPENVFIIDIFTWDRIVQIIKNKDASIIEILTKVKSENAVSSTAKQFVSMSLDDFDTPNIKLSYLSEEMKSLDVYKDFEKGNGS